MPANDHQYAYKNSRFRVEISGIPQSWFTEVIMPECIIEVIEYRQGTDQEWTRKLRGRCKFGNLILRWLSTDDTDLYLWWKSAMSGRVDRKNMRIILIDEDGQDRRAWEITNAWPIAYRPSNLEAGGNEAYTESIEIALESFVLMK
jgi:phage tail-like protein